MGLDHEQFYVLDLDSNKTLVKRRMGYENCNSAYQKWSIFEGFLKTRNSSLLYEEL